MTARAGCLRDSSSSGSSKQRLLMFAMAVVESQAPEVRLAAIAWAFLGLK